VLCVDGWSLASARRTAKDILHYSLDINHPSFDLEWRALLRDYTHRKLSRPTDRILAISGVATAYQALAGKASVKSITLQEGISTTAFQEYVAGHWLHRLPNDLLWTLFAPQAARPAVYQGPSWSWTSVNGPVGFGSVLWDDDVLGLESRRSTGPRINAQSGTEMSCNFKLPRPYWEIIKVQADLVNLQAPFGAVTGAVLTIKARCRSFNVISFSNCTVSPSCINVVLSFSSRTIHDSNTQCVKLSPDVLITDGTSPLTLMLFGWSNPGLSEYILRGLALKQIESKHSSVRRFERCGVFQVRPNDGDDVDECAEGSWRSLLPFYSTFTEEVFQIV
jgi:hypothetical protein